MRRTRTRAGVVLAAMLVFSQIAGFPLRLELVDRVFAQSKNPGGGAPPTKSPAPPTPTPGAGADPGSAVNKISQELFKMIDSGSTDYVPLIVQTSDFVSPSSVTASLEMQGASIDRIYTSFPALSMSAPVNSIATIAQDSAVKYISLDKPTQISGHLTTTTGAELARSYGTPTSGPLTGTGITIAILDSGISSAHHSFLSNRIVAEVDMTGEDRTDDPFGHGTHVASIAAGNSHISNGYYTGIAPDANLANVRVLDSNGQGSASSAIAGIDWCLQNRWTYNIRVLNLSLGAVASDSYQYDPLCQAVRTAIDAGLVVCIAAGNTGKDADGNKIYGAIHSPGIEPSAITVGAANTFGTDDRSDDQIASYSSRGPTRGFWTDLNGINHYDNLIKPDLVAPGNKILEAESPGNELLNRKPSLDSENSVFGPHKMMYMSGTSMATPVVAGAAALLLQANPNLTPNLVKALLEYTAQPLAGFSNFDQGAGELNIEGAVRLAKLVKSNASFLGVGDDLLNDSAPEQSTTIAGSTFVWGGGLIQRWNFLYGSSLILKKQGIYDNGTLLTDGTLISEGTLVANGSLLSDGTLLSQGALLSDGTYLSDGSLLADGTMLSDSTLMSDGTLISDGTLCSDSYLADSTDPSSAMASAMSALAGDDGPATPPAPDADPGS